MIWRTIVVICITNVTIHWRSSRVKDGSLILSMGVQQRAISSPVSSFNIWDQPVMKESLKAALLNWAAILVAFPSACQKWKQITSTVSTNATRRTSSALAESFRVTPDTYLNLDWKMCCAVSLGWNPSPSEVCGENSHWLQLSQAFTSWACQMLWEMSSKPECCPWRVLFCLSAWQFPSKLNFRTNIMACSVFTVCYVHLLSHGQLVIMERVQCYLSNHQG